MDIPYWIWHAVVALSITFILYLCSLYVPFLALLIGGCLYYVSRETAQQELLGYWDWPGLLAPTVAVVIFTFFLYLV